MRALFVHNPRDLGAPDSVPGGVQRCTREFLAVVEAAAEETVLFGVEQDMRLATRLRRRSRLWPYAHYDVGRYGPQIAKVLGEQRLDTVFLNRADLVELAPAINALAPDAKVVLMSHGNESGDLAYQVAMEGAGGGRHFVGQLYGALWLGRAVVAETQLRHRARFAVVAMSDEEAVLERWLGSRDVLVLPRLLPLAPVDWAPVPGRVGYVGTLSHTPNIVALRAVLSALETHVAHKAHANQRNGNGANTTPNTAPITVDIVGRPAAIGEALAAEFSTVRYRGALDDAALTEAMAGWNLFLNPIFWLSRGASMKLADALTKGVPVLTTRSGRRGYEYAPAMVHETPDDPAAFARALVALAHDAAATGAMREAMLTEPGAFPTAATLAARLNAFLASITTAPIDPAPIDPAVTPQML